MKRIYTLVHTLQSFNCVTYYICKRVYEDGTDEEFTYGIENNAHMYALHKEVCFWYKTKEEAIDACLEKLKKMEAYQMSISFKCDLCDRYFNDITWDETRYRFIIAPFKFINSESLDKLKGYDICPGCIERFEKWRENFKEAFIDNDTEET